MLQAESSAHPADGAPWPDLDSIDLDVSLDRGSAMADLALEHPIDPHLKAGNRVAANGIAIRTSAALRLSAAKGSRHRRANW